MIFNLGSIGIALLVMLPATFCAGMTLPLITYRLLRSSAGERAIGLVYSVNTLGSILGVILAVHVLMVALGVRGVLLVGAAIDVGLGVLLIASAERVPPRRATALPGPLGPAWSSSGRGDRLPHRSAPRRLGRVPRRQATMPADAAPAIPPGRQDRDRGHDD